MSGARWTPAQLLGITTTGTGVLVSAAAGSGKTAVLAQRWLFRCSSAGDLSPFLHWYFALIHVMAAIFGFLLCRDLKLSRAAAFLGGGILVVLADTLARVAVAPRELPVGIVTALIGVPAFALLMRRWTPS